MSAIESSLRLDIAQYQEQLAKARGEAKKFREQLKSDSGKGGGIGAILGGAGNELKSLLPAASVAAVVGGTRAILNEMDDLADASLRLGETTETLQRVEYASKILAGVDLGGVTGSFLKLEKALGDVENAAASKALERYGVSAESLTRLPLDEKMIMLAGAFQKARADGTGYNDLLALLGKSAGDLIPLLEQSEETLKKTFGEAIVVPEAAVQRMAALNDQVDSFIAKQKSGITDFIGAGLMALDEILDPNKKQGDNFRAAGAGADQAVADAQKKRDDKANKLAEAREKAKAEAAAAEAIKAQVKAKQELESIQGKEAALNEKRMQDYLSILPPNLKLLELKRMIMDLENQKAGLVGPGLDAQRIQIETDLLGLKKQSRDADQAIADAKTEALDKAAKEAQDSGQKAEDQSRALDLFNAELAIINAQIAGNKELTAELERKAAIQETMNRLIDQAGLSEAEALKQATAMVDAKKNLSDKEAGKDKEGSIKGFSREKMGGVEEARQRAEDRVTASRTKRDGTVDKAFGSFDAETQRQKDRFGKEFGAGPGTDPAANPLAAQAGKNAAKESTTPADPNAQAGQQVIALITQILSAVA
jgi:hypothetical protein